MATATKRKAKKATKAKAKAKASAKKAPAKKAASQPAEWTPPTGAGTFCWHELFTSDPAASKSFYGPLFGWDAADMPLGDSGATQGMISRGKDGIACLSGTTPASPQSQWLAYVQVADVDATAAKIASLGGRILTPPVDIPGGHGRYAVAKDPQGAAFAVYAMPRS
jgi:predicted enzyme related to lactoylglutathione lyase